MEVLSDNPLLSSNPLLDAIGNIDAAPLKLNALALDHLMSTKDQFRERILRHYIRQAKFQVYKMVGTADIIGDP